LQGLFFQILKRFQDFRSTEREFDRSIFMVKLNNMILYLISVQQLITKNIFYSVPSDQELLKPMISNIFSVFSCIFPR